MSTNSARNARICWLYDFLLTRGGAEQVTHQVAKAWPEVDVKVATINNDIYAKNSNKIASLTRQQPFKNALARALQTGYLFRHEARLLDDYDIAVFSGMYAPQAVLRHSANFSIYYAHTIPLPFAFDWEDHYHNSLPTGPGRVLFRRFAKRQRAVFTKCISKMDKVIANSHFVASRFERHFGVVPEVIYPPVDTTGFNWDDVNDEFIVVSTLAEHKRIDLIIKAFAGLTAQKLRIIGDGPDLDRLRKLALDQGNVIFEGSCSREKVQVRMGQCRALICVSREEAFGIVVIEAMACGKPVIAVNEGSYSELIKDNTTGVLIPADIEALRAEIIKMTPARVIGQRDECQRHARKYDQTRFFASMGEVLNVASKSIL